MMVYRSTVYSCRQTDITGVYHLKEKYLRFLRKCEHAVLAELESVRLHSGGEEKFCVTNLGFGLSSFSTYIQNTRQNQRINVIAIHSYCIKGSDLHRLSLCCYGNFHCYAGGREGLQASLMSGIRNWGIFFFDWLRVQMKYSCFRDTTVECFIFQSVFPSVS